MDNGNGQAQLGRGLAVGLILGGALGILLALIFGGVDALTYGIIFGGGFGLIFGLAFGYLNTNRKPGS